jgi:integrase
MAVYKRPDSKFYWTDFVFDGRRVQQSTKCKKKSDAQNYEASLKHQLNFKRIDLSVEKERPKALTFVDGSAELLASLPGQIAESTIRRYETASKAPLRFFGTRLIEELERKDIDAFVADRRKQKKLAPARLLKKNKKAKTTKVIKPATVNKDLAFIRMVLNYAKPGHWTKITSPDRARKFKMLKEGDEPIWRVLEPWEDRVYLMACSQPLRDAAALILETGMRPEEVLGLRTRDVNLQIGYVQVATGKTAAARRKLAISEKARAILTSRVRSSKNGLLFAGGKKGEGDQPLVKLNNAHTAAVSRSGLKKFRLYDCRHTFATRVIQAGVDLVTLKDLLGHATLAMVTRYAHPTEQHRFDAVKKLEAYTEQMRKKAI